MSSVVLQELTKSYRRSVMPAVQTLSLDIPDGCFAVLLGPSGCGKSTTLRMIAGLEEPDEGSIRLGDRVINGIPPQRRDIAFVFQNYALYPHLTVARNIGFPLKMRGMARSEINRRVKETGGILGLGHLLDRYPSQLSGGERQRVAVGRAIVRNPSVFLLDEPLSNLDAQLRAEMRVELIQLQRRLKATFVFVTHDQVEAMTLSDIIAVMNKGVLQQYGTPDDIYHHPANLFVAGFIGSPRMNLIEGMLVTQENRLMLQTDTETLPVGPVGALAEVPKKKIVLGIRPEHFRTPGDIQLEIEVVETLGSQTFVYGKTGSGLKLTVEVEPDLRPVAGDGITLSIVHTNIHLFDAETGTRLNKRS